MSRRVCLLALLVAGPSFAQDMAHAAMDHSMHGMSMGPRPGGRAPARGGSAESVRDAAGRMKAAKRPVR